MVGGGRRNVCPQRRPLHVRPQRSRSRSCHRPRRSRARKGVNGSGERNRRKRRNISPSSSSTGSFSSARSCLREREAAAIPRETTPALQDYDLDDPLQVAGSRPLSAPPGLEPLACTTVTATGTVPPFDGDAMGSKVMCTLHGKLRHADRMARKANGDWVCTGDDRCKGSDSVTLRPAFTDERDTSSLRVAASSKGGARRHKLQVRQIYQKAKPQRSAPKRRSSVASALGSSHGGSPSAQRGQSSTKDEKVTSSELGRVLPPVGSCLLHQDDIGNVQRRKRPPFPDGPIPPGMVVCSLHSRLRYEERMQKRGEQWVCKDSDRCKNADEVQCSVHHRWRSTRNMMRRGNAWSCLPDCQCK